MFAIHFNTKVTVISTIALLFSLLAHAQLTIVITDLPANTPANEPLFLAYGQNNWNPGDQNSRFYQDESGRYSITLNLTGPQELQFKVTRGNWSKVEGNEDGQYRNNHVYQYDGTKHTAYLDIASWEDLHNSYARPSTKADNVDVIATAFNMPQLGRQRRIWIYLPPDYRNSNNRYPVIYMHDAQNLFDQQTSFSGEWRIDESLNYLFGFNQSSAIVVGIDNGGANRINEYSPWQNSTYGGGEGDEYTEFIVNTLKPHIDRNYRTLGDASNTGIIGSSMGGLVSLYAAVEYPGVFGKAGIFSPSLWFSEQAFQHVAARGKRADQRYYLLAGSQEGGNMLGNIQRLENLLRQIGFQDHELELIVKQDGAHSEWFWAREFPDAYIWLFKN